MDKLFSKYFFRQMGHQFRCHEFQGQVNIRFNTSVQVFFPKLWTYYCHDFPLQDCSHVSKTREEFYSVRCTVADMKSLYVRLLFSVVIVLVNLRDSEIKQDLPKQSENNCKRCLGCSGALLWKNLHVYWRKSVSVGRFETEIDRRYNNCRSGSTQQYCKTV